MIVGILAITCAALLSALIVALIFVRDFRKEILEHEGEAKIGGVISVKGVAMVLLCALLTGVMIVALTKIDVTETKASAAESLPLLAETEAAQLKNITDEYLRSRQEIDLFLRERWYPVYLENFVRESGVLKTLENSVETERPQIVAELALTAIDEALKKRDELTNGIDSTFAQDSRVVREKFRRRAEAILLGH